MKFAKGLALFVVVSGVLIILAFYFLFMLNPVPGCANLQKVFRNKEITDKFWNSILQKFDEKSELRNLEGLVAGTILAKKVSDKFRLDWESLGIPSEVATFGIRGKNFTYQDPNIFAVDEIWVGHLYSANLIFKVVKDDEKPNDISSLSYDLMVECRTR